MIDNIEIFKISMKNKEPYLDEYYIKKNELIITDNNKKQNNLMKANLKILDNITAYEIAVESKNSEMQNTILKNMISILETTSINFSEFVSYWSVKDITYSLYKRKLKTESLKIEFLKDIIPEFIKDRHLLYKRHGYSFSTLQVVKDSKAHKENSDLANKKITKLLEEYKFSHFKSKDIKGFKLKDKILFKEILDRYKINFKWSKNHQNKQTDFLFKIGGKIFIMEHKHIKESGGGQNKQMTEIIDFISYKDDQVSYVSFLDGIYFNILSDKNTKKGKPVEQRETIIDNLNNNKQNYFVNTHGFIKMIKNLSKINKD